jgi:hypothetical protein
VGQEHNWRRGRALALRRVAPQRGLEKVLRQLFKALRPNGLCRFHVGDFGAAAAAALMAAVAALSRERRAQSWCAPGRPRACVNDLFGA